jgi:penicillin G amidase
VTALVDQLADAGDLTFADFQTIEQRAGVVDIRAREYLPLILGLADAGDLGDREAAALELLAGWDGSHLGPGAGTDEPQETDGPAPTIFDAVVEAIRDELFGDLPAALLERQTGVGSHVFDMSAADNLAVRVLDPTSSGLTTSRDYTGGRGAEEVLRVALAAALDVLEERYGSTDPADYRRTHPRSEICSLTGGVIGPCLTMPYQDRGSWIHVVAFAGADAPAPPEAPPATTSVSAPPAAQPPPDPGRGLPATGGGVLGLALGGVLFLGGVVLRPGRRRPGLGGSLPG